MGDTTINIHINKYEGENTVTNNNQTTTTNNSTTISGGTVTGNQFAAGSTDFKGTINNITAPQQEKLNQLTDDLIAALKLEADKIEGTNVDEVTDAVNQAREAASKETVNKLSLNGVLTGINMVMENITNLSTSTTQLYQQWHGHIASLFV